MRHSRRTVLSAGLGLAGAALLRTRPARATEITFADDPFTLGVASGYPEPNAAVLWTRLAPQPLVPGGGMPASPVAVEWEVGADEALRTVVRRGTVYATPDWAHSVHVEVTGLEPARDYWYRFTSGGARSPIARTRTAAARGTLPNRLTLAVASCQHFEQGHYAAYRAIADDAVDVVVHVGDYIYEGRGTSRVRMHDAPECHTLEDYRQRYAIYKSDPHLKAAHAASPWMIVSDDHEVANDYAADHSEQDDPPELFLARRDAAYQAFYEHLPLPRRLVPFGGRQRLYTSRAFGDLAAVFMLDGRQYRSRQACQPGPYVEPCSELRARERTMLGDRQEQWLGRSLAASGARWNLLGQQTVLAHFDQSGDGPRAYWDDGWNGYPAARDRLVATLLERPASNPVVFGGDIHAFLVNDVQAVAMDHDSRIVATELVTSSISSVQGQTQETFDLWKAENPNVRLARGDYRGYLRVAIAPERLQADLVAVDDVTRADSPTHVLASFDVENGKPGVAR
ncbi:MAG TPA: alkaline phosphatase D family protein [Gammaproteobacteria bacterium]|nr:alkaline phosphatase D family protein [Gammaproteobacteria bacterium]